MFVSFNFFFFFCRGGKKEDNKRKGDPRDKSKFSRLIGCPFSAHATFFKASKEWYFETDYPSHNHPASQDPRAHIANRRLTPAQYEKVKNLTQAGLKPSEILRVMQTTAEPTETLLATKNTIYAAKRRVKTESLQSLSPMVQLKQNLSDSDYTTQVKTDSDGTLKALFFCHNSSLELLQAYNTILFLDSTYKTNKYKMPLLHIAGVSGNNNSFSVAFCFLAEENVDYYTWALKCFSSVISVHEITPPEVLMTDRELALMNAIEDVFPNSTHMLCTWHIEKNILTNATQLIKDQDLVRKILSHWSNLIKISTPSEFYSSFSRFAAIYPGEFIEYVEKTWIPLAPRFANAWTKKITHFDHRTSSRIESSHSYIKTHLLNSQASLPEVVKLITLALQGQHHEIKSEFHQQKITALQNIHSIFSLCHGKISNFALRTAHSRYRSLNHEDPGRCHKNQQKRTGIPCKHRIAQLLHAGKRVDPKEFHTQWHLKVCLFFNFIPVSSLHSVSEVLVFFHLISIFFRI